MKALHVVRTNDDVSRLIDIAQLIDASGADAEGAAWASAIDHKRGTVLLYYGEEISMGTMPTVQLHSAPIGLRRPRADDRDGERTPMQWNAKRNAGFSAGSPWLPVEADYKSYNVESEKPQSDSIFAWYSALIRLRHQSLVFQEDKYVPLEAGNPEVFAFGRRISSNESGIVLLNCSPKQQKVHIAGLSGSWPHLRAVMASPVSRLPLCPSMDRKLKCSFLIVG